ncbi:stromal cell-derived factor 2-like [Corticium candelabrum]|uniref:stromal cell-derived factor 2-like n=1 Tax=Corticium candelabrum TaxID=121492 RepID=UPI002E25501E|nr:stromal cell-derived factor 2-like [Corticium candelabrum]
MSLLLCTLFITLFVDIVHAAGFQFVTCGSVIKLAHIQSNVRLHSHEVRYGSGSGQQSVTGVTDTGDANSYWVVKGTQDKPCKRGVPIKCGTVIRLNHLQTRLNLHSHFFQSPLSNNQEVSAFGENGEGDSGDYWTVQCDDDFWRRDDIIHLKHKDTGRYLHASHNQFGRPISGQREICAIPSQGQDTLWQAMEGIYLKPSDGTS